MLEEMTNPLFIGTLVFTAGLVGWLIVQIRRESRLERFLRAHGRPADATVVSARETGSWSGNAPELALVLKVQETGQPVRELRTQKVIPVLGAALFQPGATMRVLVHPDDPNVFLFDEPWNAPDEKA